MTMPHYNDERLTGWALIAAWAETAVTWVAALSAGYRIVDAPTLEAVGVLALLCVVAFCVGAASLIACLMATPAVFLRVLRYACAAAAVAAFIAF